MSNVYDIPLDPRALLERETLVKARALAARINELNNGFRSAGKGGFFYLDDNESRINVLMGEVMGFLMDIQERGVRLRVDQTEIEALVLQVTPLVTVMQRGLQQLKYAKRPSSQADGPPNQGNGGGGRRGGGGNWNRWDSPFGVFVLGFLLLTILLITFGPARIRPGFYVNSHGTVGVSMHPR